MTVVARFEKQVRRHGARTAVRDDAVSLTYEELDRTANRVACSLRAMGGASGRPVGVVLGHDAPAFGAILGVLKAGGICLPLAATHPAERLAAILEESGASIVVTDRERLPLVEGLGARDRLVLEDLAEAPDEHVCVEIPPGSPAFLLYTSGSTGGPRGVVQTHELVLDNVRRLTRGLRLRSADRIAILASTSTGQGVSTTFCALLNGATLCPRDLARKGVTALDEWLASREITVLVAAASVFRQFLRGVTAPLDLPRLRFVRLGADAVRPGDVERFRAFFPPHCLLANTYSSTETGNVAQFVIDHGTRLDGATVPVGRPPRGVELSIVDEEGREAPPGAVGEIAVGGRRLSPGYWRDPDLTRARFRRTAGGDGTVFLTGDLGRIDAHGRLEHLGRKDDQVKVRGVRIRPEEIRARLAEHPDVHEALVEPVTDVAGDTRLVAFVAAPWAPGVRELRAFLRQRLPEAMIPSAIVVRDALPRTPAGKLDRQALRALAASAPSPAGAPADAEAPVEEMLAGIWSDLLRVESVGSQDTFFELGGDSLLVTELLCRIEHAFGVDVPLRTLFEEPTLEDLAANVRRLRQRSEAGLPSVDPVRRGRPLPLSFLQERVWRHCRTPAATLGYVLSNGLALDGALDSRALERALDEVVRRHETLRTTIREIDGVPCQMIAPAAPHPLRKIDLSRARSPEAEFGRLWAEEASLPVDLEHGPVLRATLARLGDTRHRLILTYHHIISDGRSRAILLRELGSLYAAFSRGERPSLEEPPVQYGDFAVWQRRLLRRDGEHYREQLAYWRSRLAGHPPPLELPFRRREAAEAPSALDARVSWSVPPEVARGLTQIGRRRGATIFMTRLAGLVALLRRLAGREDVVLGNYATSRNRPELQNVIGFFSNLLTLRLDAGRAPSFLELLDRVRAATLDAVSHADVPYESVREDLDGEGLVIPDLQIIFNVQHEHSRLDFGDLEARALGPFPQGMPWGLQVLVSPYGDATGGSVFFDAGLYEPAGIAEMIAAYRDVLAAAAADPERRLS